MHSGPKILVFDSGAGGLSVAKEIISMVPCSLVYAADNAFFPYGTKDDHSLSKRIVAQVERLVVKHCPDIVVIACNTASTLALDTLRAEFSCPFVGVVPAIKPAAKLTTSGVIALLATPATITRPYTQQLIQDFAPQHHVILHGSDNLVSLAEKKLRIGKIEIDEVERELSQLFDRERGNEIDTVVLACTHFPLLREELSCATRNLNISTLKFVDSGNAIARRVRNLLGGKEFLNAPQTIDVTFSCASSTPEIKASFEQFLRN